MASGGKNRLVVCRVGLSCRHSLAACFTLTPADLSELVPRLDRSHWPHSVMTAQEGMRPDPATKGVSLVIPAWNEEARLRETLGLYVQALEAAGLSYEIFVVCDGSTDGTLAIARSFSHSGVRAIEASDKLGKGGAVVAGLRQVSFAVCGFVDADGPIPGESLVELVQALDKVDCAIASRAVPRSSAIVARSADRRLLSKVWNLSVRGILLLPVRDSQCGAKFFRTTALRSVLDDVKVTNWAFDISILYELRRRGFTIREVGVHWSERAGSKLRVLQDAPRMFLSLVGIRLRDLRPGVRGSRVGERAPEVTPSLARSSTQESEDSIPEAEPVEA